MTNTHKSKECTLWAPLITTFMVIGRLLCITGLLFFLVVSEDACAQSAVVKQLPPTVEESDKKTIVEVRIEEMRLLKSQCHNSIPGLGKF